MITPPCVLNLTNLTAGMYYPPCLMIAPWLTSDALRSATGC